MNTRVLVAVVAAALAVTTSACGSTTDGHGAGPTRARTSSGTDFPSRSASPTAPSSQRIPPPARTVTVEGTTTGQKITGNVYADDTLTRCATHAYGAPMIAFLRRHPCIRAHRVLATIVVDGRLAVLSAVDASFGPIGNDPYAATAAFVQLERADNTGSINDLLREGHAIPGVATRIPAHEVFQVVAQDNSATVLDAWYVSGSTSDNDPALKRVETDVFLTPLSWLSGSGLRVGRHHHR